MLTKVLIAASFLLVATCAAPLTEDRIYGGAEAVPGQFPHQISLRVNVNDTLKHICGGSIISERFILTAAHCYPERFPNIEDYRVVVGGHKRNADDGQTHEVVRFTQHEEYNHTTIQNDIAVVEVRTKIEFNDRVSPIPLNRHFVEGGAQAITSGWGLTNDTITNLKFTFVYTLTNDECRQRIREEESEDPEDSEDSEDEIYDGTLCVYSRINGTGVCSGDSGGPLVYENELIGVTSWAFLCARGLPDGFTRVSEYIEWIEAQIKS